MNITSFSTAVFLTSMTVFVMACTGSGEPSESDLRTALEAQSEVSYAKAVAKFGEEEAAMMVPTLNEVKKISCTETADGAVYDCEFEIDFSLGRRNQKQKVRERVHLGERGWAIVSRQK